MESTQLNTFRSTPEMREKLFEYGVSKTFSEGDVILNENAYIRAIPIVTKGSIRVMHSDEEGKELLLYYIQAGESCIIQFINHKGF